MATVLMTTVQITTVKKRSAYLLGAAILASLVLVGCGGSNNAATPTTTTTATSTSSSAVSSTSSSSSSTTIVLSKTEYIAKANAICKDAEAKSAKLPEPGTDVASQLKSIEESKAINVEQLKKLRELSVPKIESAFLEPMFAKADLVIAYLDALSAAIKTGDQSLADTANGSLTAAVDAANLAFTSYGMTVCGS